MKINSRAINRVIILFIVFLFSLSIVSANSNFLTWGGGYLLAGGSSQQTGNLFFGSNNPYGNVNFTEIIISVSQKFQPIVYNIDSDANNEIYLIGTKRIYQYDHNGVLVGENLLSATICGNPTIATDNDVLTMVVMTYDGTNYIMNYLKMVGSVLTLSETDTISETGHFTCELHGGIDYTGNSNFIFVVKTDNDVLRYDIENNQETVYTGSGVTKRARNITETFGGGGQSFIRSSPAGNFLVAWASKDVGNTKSSIIIYNINQDTFLTEETEFVTTSNNVSLSGFTLGSQGGPPTFVLRVNTEHTFFDVDANRLLRYTSGGGSATYGASWYCVADIDYDGLNEWCNIDNTGKMECLNNALTIDFELNLTPQTSNTYDGYFGCGEYTDLNNTGDDSYLEFLTSDGLYAYNTATQKLEKAYDFGATPSVATGMFLPVSIRSTNSFVKDILYANFNTAIYYVSSGDAVVCGDGVCGVGEHSLNCPADCLGGLITSIINESQGSFGAGQSCSQNSDCYGDLICSGGLCSGLPGGTSCTQDFECDSGNCNSYGFCEKIDFVDNVQQGVKQLGFTSTASKYFIALLLLLLGAGVGAGVLSAGGSIGALIGGIIGLVIGSIMAVVVFSWIGVAVVFIILFLGIVAVFLLTMFRGG